MKKVRERERGSDGGLAAKDLIGEHPTMEFVRTTLLTLFSFKTFATFISGLNQIRCYQRCRVAICFYLEVRLLRISFYSSATDKGQEEKWASAFFFLRIQKATLETRNLATGSNCVPTCQSENAFSLSISFDHGFRDKIQMRMQGAATLQPWLVKNKVLCVETWPQNLTFDMLDVLLYNKILF